MNMDDKITNMLLACIIALGVLCSHRLAVADDAQTMEKCYGIVKAGLNDCDNGSSVCDKSVLDADPNYWMYLPKGACNKIVGGMTMMGTDTTNPVQSMPSTVPTPAPAGSSMPMTSPPSSPTTTPPRSPTDTGSSPGIAKPGY